VWHRVGWNCWLRPVLPYQISVTYLNKSVIVLNSSHQHNDLKYLPSLDPQYRHSVSLCTSVKSTRCVRRQRTNKTLPLTTSTHILQSQGWASADDSQCMKWNKLYTDNQWDSIVQALINMYTDSLTQQLWLPDTVHRKQGTRLINATA